MRDWCVAGHIFRPGDGFEEGWLLHDGRVVLDTGTDRPPRTPDVSGIILPGMVNAHTHVADRVGRGMDLSGMDLASVVAPPNGLKHRLLRETPPEKLVAGMRTAASEMMAVGVRAFLDFREGGLAGVRQFRKALEGLDIEGVALARCDRTWTDGELAAVLAEADGIGFPSLGDVSDDAPERAAAACHAARKTFAIHFSEGRREDVARVLALEPDFLVHVCHANANDLDGIADAHVPVVLCPRSNARFGARADVPGMLERGIPLALGSDNAMFHDADLMLDLRHLGNDWPALAQDEVLDLAVAGGWRILEGGRRGSWLRKGDPADMVAYLLHGDPYYDLFGDRPLHPLERPWTPRKQMLM